MKITIELPESDVKDICRMTGEKKKARAIRRFVLDALMLKRRHEIAQKFISGEWGAELKGFEESQAADRKADRIGERSRRK